ncbi:phosphoadenylyl-sulfate reductase [Salinibacter ruber]|uniref:phosphoadenylyl-sulfate reductase n=1 Tax=Salinibacter ruber TaxID=146919 RepID=UPI002074175D|nr:phosphoadenylyl-sulfate reductase [Salinibacter ruber]MCS4200826.1 phosphoadenosine phosphosulfate reductase [Salinibacter ruber]
MAFASDESASPWSSTRLAALNAQFEPHGPKAILNWATHTFGEDLAQGTGFGPSGIVIMHILADLRPGTTVFYLDTDLLFPETYELCDDLDERLDVDVTRVHGGLSLDEQAEQEGEELWNRNPNRCCFLRKVKPLRNFLDDRRAWITGVRRDQSERRADTDILSWEGQYGVFKINPLANWTQKEVWKYLFEHDLPYNPKHDQGYPSLGCVPCTEPVDQADGYSREGRWGDRDKTECGLHTSPEDEDGAHAAES